jgi:FkbM family methyltransferase
MKWPKPLWILRGFGDFDIGGYRFRFHDVASPPLDWWGWNVRDGLWEADVLEFFVASVRPSDIVFDVGAHVGAYSLLASRLVGPEGHVYAFEPDPVARDLLERNILANGGGNITVSSLAVSDSDGWAALQTTTNLGNSCTVVVPSQGRSENAVPTMTLKSLCQGWNLRPDIIKIDVEGHEASILSEDAAEVLYTARAVIVELHDDYLLESGSSSEALLQRLGRMGLRILPLGSRWPGNHHVALAGSHPETDEAPPN